MRLTLEKLRDIFYSGPYAFKGDNTLIQKIYFLISHDYLKFSRIIVAEKAAYFDLCDNQNKILKQDEASGGGLSHVALKLLAQEYFKGKSMSVSFEQSFCGYYPDVISIDKQAVVECGHTDNADKILVYFTQGNIAELIQIPYPADDDDHVYGYSFSPKPGLAGFLDTEFEINKSSILDIINRNGSN